MNTVPNALPPMRPIRKVVIAMDSFKGCLTSIEAGNAAMKGIIRALPHCEIVRIAISDGGEGLLDAQVPDESHRIYLNVHGPWMEEEKVCYGIAKDKTTVIIETSRICGLPLVPILKRNPALTTTYGVGEVICHALDQGYRRFLIGLGGSATNDAGTGMLQALGYRFLTVNGEEIKGPLCGNLLSQVAAIDDTKIHPALKESCFTAICDVRNPLFGPEGAAHMFAPQKGADKEMVERLDKALQHIAQVIENTTGNQAILLPGTGAAGGMGVALSTFLKAELKSGIQMLLKNLHFEEQIKNADLIITGEGQSDRQTLMGKVPQGVLEQANRYHIPTILLSGSLRDIELLNKAGFKGVFSITQAPISLEEALKTETAQKHISQTAEQIGRVIVCKLE